MRWQREVDTRQRRYADAMATPTYRLRSGDATLTATRRLQRATPRRCRSDATRRDTKTLQCNADATARKKGVTLTRRRGDADAIRGRRDGDAMARDDNVTASQRLCDAGMTVTR